MKDYTSSLICTELGKIKQNYDSRINIVEGLTFSQKFLIKTIEFYSNSKYLNGQVDELGREKPFFNIINAMCDVENAAKDIDTKDIQATSDDGRHYTESFLMTKDIYEWMKSVNFAKTLNDMRDMHTRYGSLLVKKVTRTNEDGEKQLFIEMPEWKNVITDQINILDNPIVECHYMTVWQLSEMSEWKNKSDIMEQAIANGYSSRIPVYEVRGKFPVSFIKELDGKKVTKADKTKFSYQLYYLAAPIQSAVAPQTAAGLTWSPAFTPLYWEDNTEKVYKYAARKKKAGRAFGVGVSEEGEEAQVWSNDTVLKQYRAMAYTTKVVGQTASKKLKGRNMLNEVDDGQILEHEDGKPITSLQLLPAGGLGQYGNLLQQWFTQYERATSSYSAQRGESPSSRTSAKLQSAVLQQSGSVLDGIKEDLGIFIVELFEDWIMPFLVKKLSAAHILSHDFSLSELQEIDKNFATHTANQMAIDAALSGQLVTMEDYATFTQQADQMIKQTKTKRFLALPKDYYKKVKAKITINITGEQQNKGAILSVLSELMSIYSANPALTQDPVLTELFMRIVEMSGAGISPVTLIAAFQEKAKMQAEAAKQSSGSQDKVSQSINYKDLSPEGRVQLAAKAGINITNTMAPEPVEQPEPMEEPEQ